eukprot:6594068-Prymnesium_polylepis.1
MAVLAPDSDKQGKHTLDTAWVYDATLAPIRVAVRAHVRPSMRPLHAGRARDRRGARERRGRAPGRLQLRLLGSPRQCASPAAAAAPSS